MYRIFFFTLLLVYCESSKVFSQPAPSVTLSPQVTNELPGWGVPSTEGLVLNCENLLNKQWAYPSGGVVAICNETELSCFRYGLIQDRLKKTPMPDLEKELAFARQDVELKLLGCKLAIEAGISGTPFLPGTTTKDFYKGLLKQ